VKGGTIGTLEQGVNRLANGAEKRVTEEKKEEGGRGRKRKSDEVYIVLIIATSQASEKRVLG
jgi:hypothetical protein